MNNEFRIKRNSLIREMRDAGYSDKKIGIAYNLTTERIRQICNSLGSTINEERKDFFQNIISNIKKDIELNLCYEEIMNKYELKEANLTRIYFWARFYKMDLPIFLDFFIKKRNEIIINEFKKGKTAKEILNNKNKFLNGYFKIKGIGLIYSILAKNGVYRFPTVGKRCHGGYFENKEVLNKIKFLREKKNYTFGRISKYFSERNILTIGNKIFTPQNICSKYKKWIKQSYGKKSNKPGRS